MPGPCAPASAATRMLTWPPWNSKRASQLCRSSLFCPHRTAELGETIRAAQRTAATPPRAGADPAPRWTLRRLVPWARERFGLRCCRETIRAALHCFKLSWKKAKKLLGKKLLGRADPERRQAFIERVRDLLAGAQRDQHLVVFLDEAHIHQDCDLGYGWGERGQRFWVASRSPGLSARVSFYGLYSTMRVRCGCGPLRGPTAGTPSRSFDGSVPNGPIASGSCCGTARPTIGRPWSTRWLPPCTSTSCRYQPIALTSCRSRRCGAGCAKTSPIITAIPAPRT